MKITAIQAQVKTAGRYSVFVDGEYSFSLSDTALLDTKIVVGQELTPSELKDLKQRSAEDKLYGQALRYLALRPRSEWELTTYLARKGSSDPHQQSILNKLSNLGLIDDEAFARAWVESRRMLKATSRLRLQAELRQKHIADDIISDVLSEETVSDSDALKDLIARKRKQVKYHDDTKLMQYLARQGFRYDDIKNALSNQDDL